MKNIIFVTGTNTGVGKTFFICNLLKRLYEKYPKLKKKVIGYKLIETGVRLYPEDALRISKINGFYIPPLYTFIYPLAPFDAANLEKRTIKKEKVIEKLKELSKKFDLVFIEGAGGIEVPIFPFYTFLDLVKELNLKTILVSENKLGTINNTLLSAKVLKDNLFAIYLNTRKDEQDISQQVNLRTLNLYLRKKYMINAFVTDSIDYIIDRIISNFSFQ